MKSILNIIVFALVVLFCEHANAQQYIGHTQFMWNQTAINPAYTGTKKSLSAGVFYRNQWVGFSGAPVTENVFVHSPISHGDFGVGLNLMRDRLGIFTEISAQGSFSYKLSFDQGTLSLGLSGEYGSQRVDWTQVDPFSEGDQAIPFADISQTEYNFGFGAYFSNEIWFAGVSVPRLLEDQSTFVNEESNISALLQARRHIYVTGGVMWQLSRNVYIQPVTMLRYVEGAPFQPDLGCLFLINKQFWVGPSLRWGDSVSLLLDYSITKQLKVGYAFDFTITQLQGHGGTHEFFLGYDLRKKKDGYNHPRFF